MKIVKHKFKDDKSDIITAMIQSKMVSYLLSVTSISDKLVEVEKTLADILKTFDTGVITHTGVITRWNDKLNLLKVYFRFSYRGTKMRGEFNFNYHQATVSYNFANKPSVIIVSHHQLP